MPLPRTPCNDFQLRYPVDMAHRHVPHSTGWFQALTQDDPEGAAHTANVLADAERDDVCGECGDVPASDYEMQGVERSDGSRPTMRFCPVCAVIRRGLGERWASLTW